MRLRWLDSTTLPCEAPGLTPERLLGMSPDDVRRLSARVGNAGVELGELFDCGDDSSTDLTFEGDLRPVRKLGENLASGRIVIHGQAGPFLGLGMTCGAIEVFGSAGDWAGAAMGGGLLRIRGDAGRSLGSGLPGARLGMKDGVILVDGSVGDEAGARLRRGLIAVGGSVGRGLGRGMIAGTIFAFGPVGDYPGIGMKRGTIGLFAKETPRLLPSFLSAGSYRVPFLTIYLRRLAELGFAPARGVSAGAVERYNGDIADHGIGEVLLAGSAGWG